MHGCCTPTCRKWTLFGFAAFFLLFGILLVLFTDDIVQAVKNQELNVGSNKTKEYKNWEETPIPMYIDFYLFNWTNAKEVIDSKWTIKPNFTQLGPYSFHEKHYRKNVIFNHNRTVTYQTQRLWHFAPEKTVGSLDDSITTINPILLTVANMIKYKHSLVKMGIDFFLEEKKINLTVTKTAREFLFDGYEDPILDLLKKLHLKNMDIPFTKFGWFANRNGSITYDGTYNMYDGSDDVRKLGKFTAWNYEEKSSYYPGHCGQVGGTSGELWYPVKDDKTIQVFSADVCSTLTLERNGTFEMLGVQSHKFVATEQVFDNGTLHPEMACFSPGEVVPSGVRNISECKFGAPAFLSYPHFYLADPFYTDAIVGMKPNASEHQMTMSIEPQTGIPVQVKVAAQINLKVEKIDKIKLLENVKTHYMPALWFKQYATVNEYLADQAKLLLTLPSIGHYTGYGIVGLGCLLAFIFGFVTWKKLWRGSDQEILLNQDAF
ncbi:protein croquemort-like isoform X2 [Zophobas morio]